MDFKKEDKREKINMPLPLPIISVQQSTPDNSNFSPGETIDDNKICQKNVQALNTDVTEEERQMTENRNPMSLKRQDEQLSTIIRRRMTVPNENCQTSAFRRSLSEEAKLEAASAENLERRLKSLVNAFSARTNRTKAKIKQLPTPSSSESEADEASGTGETNLLERLMVLCSPDPSEFRGGKRKSISQKVKGSCMRKLKSLLNFLTCNYILDADGTLYMSWLVLVSLCFLYNAWVIPLRAIFPYQTPENLYVWNYLDYFADAVYFVDIIAFKSHRKFIQEGFWIKDPKQTRKSYFKTLQFKIDLLALFPADILVSMIYKNYPLLRIPRILKIETYWELFRRFDTILASPHSARITYTMIYMMYMIHSNACAYYGLSTWEGIGTTTWTFDGLGNAYIRCFYFATKTATSIGKNPKPENEMEYLFMIFAWLSGVFVFAVLIGQIRDIIATATKNQTEYRAMTYAAISHLHGLGVPKKLQNKVQLWLSYTWEQQKTLDEGKILDLLPHKMRTDVALNLHVETISKVKLFQNCEVAFLRDLVVKLRSIIFLPGDYVCRKGEVGREMYIVKSGKIHVIGGASGKQILVTLGEGSVFGEIALLGIGGMNKRTADVRAAGFANLFVLNKAGLDEAIRDYPSSQEMMKKKAKKLMKENMKRGKAAAATVRESTGGNTSQDSLSELGEEVIIKNKQEQPKLIDAMMQIFPPESKIGRYLSRGSKAGSELDLFNKSLDALTSYPPTPYMPTSPGHISPELDISIMSGDSSDKQLSPPPISRPSSKQEFYQLKLQSRGYNEDESRSNSGSSADELKEYLDSEDSKIRQSSFGNLILSDEQGRCPSPLPPVEIHLSPTLEEQENDFIAEKFIDTTFSGTLLPPGAVTPIPRRLSTEMVTAITERSASIDQKRHSAPEMFVIGRESREVLPVDKRPPMYPIVLGAFPCVSLSSGEESEDHDGSGNKKGSEKMTARSAAIIASRFLTRIRGRPLLRRQVPVGTQPDPDNVETVPEYDTE